MGVRYEPYWQPVAYNFDRTNWYPDLYTGVGSAAAAGIVQANHNGINGSTVHNDMNNFMPRRGHRLSHRREMGGADRRRSVFRSAHRPDRPAGIPEFAWIHLREHRLLGGGKRLLAEDAPTISPSSIRVTARPLSPFRPAPTQAINYAAIERNTKTDNAWQWNFTVQRQLPGDTIVEAAYVGTKGTHLMGNYVGNPFIPIGFNPENPQPGTLVPKYPGLGLDLITGQGASSNYNALQITVKKRVASGTLHGGLYQIQDHERRRGQLNPLLHHHGPGPVVGLEPRMGPVRFRSSAALSSRSARICRNI